ncbi:MAG TPA: aldo/keto reductase [Fibrobacteria bacterium]|nr:aldo/keto reductase [Fibrobacteria bacterium]
MKLRGFGKTGLRVSEVGFGAWALGESWWGKQDDAESLKALHRAAELGADFIDTAQVYGEGKSESMIARFRKEWKGDLIVATKTPPEAGAWPPSPYDGPEIAYSPAYLRANVEQRLRSLQTDCLDILQLHTWTRAWNKDPQPFETLRRLQKEGKIRFIGVSTPEHDQNSVVDLIRNGWVDSVQVIYNIFEQEPAAEILPSAKEHGVGIIVRMAFDEGALTGKFARGTVFPKGDFRAAYFRGERLGRVVDRVDRIKADVEGSGFTLPQAALKFAMSHPGVSTVIAGIRNVAQAEMNLAVSDLPDLPPALLQKLRGHNWRRGIWYGDHW